METLMIVIVIVFTMLPNGNIGTSYKAKPSMKRSIQECRAVQKAFDEKPDKNQSVIVLCFEAGQPVNKPQYHDHQKDA